MKSKPIASAALALLAAGAALISACGDSAGVPLTTTPVPPAAGKVASIDVIDIDQAAHLLYAADRSDQGVDVFDISASRPKYLQTIPMPSGPNGLAIAPELSRLFVGTSGGSVVIVNINTSSSTYGAVISEVKTGEGVDLLDYGTARQRIYAAHSSAGTITSIDAATGTIMAKFAVGSVMLEQPRFDAADGMVYITSPDADALFRIDPNDGHVKTKFTLAGRSVAQIAQQGLRQGGLALWQVSPPLRISTWTTGTQGNGDIYAAERAQIAAFDCTKGQFRLTFLIKEAETVDLLLDGQVVVVGAKPALSEGDHVTIQPASGSTPSKSARERPSASPKRSSKL